jgi:hypothetical protein
MKQLLCYVFIFVICSSLLFLTSYAYAQNNTERSPPETIEWKNYNSTILGLSIDYPSTWNIQEKQNRFEESCSNCPEGTDLAISSFVNVSGKICSCCNIVCLSTSFFLFLPFSLLVQL